METMTGQTTRPATFVAVNSRKVVTETRTFPTGTVVYVTETRRGTFAARVAGTLFTQELNLTAVESL